MPRPIWSGSISFGLVNVPVKLYTAVSRKTVHFNQIDSRSGSRIRYKKVSAADESEVPAEAIVKGYALPTRAMEETGKVAVARFVMRSKQYLCAVRPKDGHLVLSTMVYADEVNEPAEIGEIAGLEDIEVTKKELEMARQLIASL